LAGYIGFKVANGLRAAQIIFGNMLKLYLAPIVQVSGAKSTRSLLNLMEAIGFE
jgi:ABC-type dipeptide/oligopeptide/nickel transport system permease component